MITTLLLFLLCPFLVSAQWNPDAGVIPSYTWNATVIASSGSNGANVIDRDDQTNWQSGAPLPNGFMSNAGQNIFKNFCELGFCKHSAVKNAAHATDANLSSSAVVSGSGNAWFMLAPVMKGALHSVSVKCLVSAPLKIYAHFATGDSSLLATLTAEDNYKWKRFETDMKNVAALTVQSTADFTLFEIAATGKPLTESVVVDFGKVQRVGWVETRHWAGGKAASTALYASVDNQKWQLLSALNPDALLKVTTRLQLPVDARYLKIEHTLKETDYAKVFVWEINAWDEFGPFGKMPEAKKATSTVAEIMGINGIWGWGYDKYSDNMQQGEGQKKFRSIVTHARNFHDMHWDVKDPDNIPDYSKMATSGTAALSWLNWDREYRAWKDAGLKVDVTIKYSSKSLPQAVWDNPYYAAYYYANTFARHFGPTYGNGLVDVFEAGNEPWDYPAEFFTQIQKGMMEGAKAGDPALTVLPCALQCGFPSEETKNGGNYAGARLTADMAKYMDAFNAHHYSYASDTNGKRRGIYPEHPESSARAILNDIRFCEANLPGKKIYVTEWGWDSDGAGEECAHSECVSELEQAIYGIRGAMFFMRLGVSRLTWYFFANGKGGLYSRSGLLGSAKTGFQEKQAFNAFQKLIELLGDRYFLRVLQENDEAYVYQFGDAQGNATHLVAWRPVAGSDTAATTIQMDFHAEVREAWTLDGISRQQGISSIARYDKATQKLHLNLTARPVVIGMTQ